jgi:hypothetical protein
LKKVAKVSQARVLLPEYSGKKSNLDFCLPLIEGNKGCRVGNMGFGQSTNEFSKGYRLNI